CGTQLSSFYSILGLAHLADINSATDELSPITPCRGPLPSSSPSAVPVIPEAVHPLPEFLDTRRFQEGSE
ncbi:hypothetical protein ACWGBV_35990, partial [Streptomyces sp. NPDC055051]